MSQDSMSDRRAAADELVLPQAIEAERAVLAAMMLGNEAIGRAIELASSNMFYRPANRKMFEAMVALYDKNEPVDLITVCEKLHERGDLEAVGGRQAVAEVFEYATTSANLDYHVRLVQEKAVLRALIQATRSIQQMAFAGQAEYAEILDTSEQLIFQITDDRVRKGVVPLRSFLKDLVDKIQKLGERAGQVTGVPTGFTDLDRLTLGFQPGDLVIIAGRPAMGKSAFAVNVAENAAIRYKVPVALFSLEMSDMQLATRMLSSQSDVPLFKLRSGHLSQEDWRSVAGLGLGYLQTAPIWIDDSATPTVLEIRAKCRRLKAEGNLGMVIIDYLQMVRAAGKAENRVQEISQITRALKALAKELDVPVVALSQLSRAVDQRTGGDRRPQLSDLRESGSIEQDADLVMFVYREEYYKRDDPSVQGKGTIIVAKHRNGPTGDVDLTFRHELTKFVDHAVVLPSDEAHNY